MKFWSIVALTCSLANAAPTATLPVVDLGYQLQQASAFNSTGGYYNFSNIRYAAPPVGNLRFAAPVAPSTNRTGTQNGLQRRICAQASPAWFLTAQLFIPEYLSGAKTNFTPADFPPAPTTLPAADPDTSEDCLFLDVFVPTSVWNNRITRKVPVIFWIYGGGYTAGDKAASGSPAGLLEHSLDNGGEGAIYVAPNYRLGALGWSSGPSFTAAGGVPNAGLHDQRFALEWVQKNIALFGGDKCRVTVLGESAGGGSIEHQITAYGGAKGPSPFKQAIPQSPGFTPNNLGSTQETVFQTFLATLGVKSLAAARALPFQAVALANTLIVGGAFYGSFVYGPVVDGTFVPDLPGTLLAKGKFDKSLKIMSGENTDEGLLFTSPFVSTDTSTDVNLRQYLLTNIPTLKAKPDQLNYILKTLYPPVFDGSGPRGYRDRIARSAAITSDFAFSCNNFYLDKAYSNKTYGYQFAVPPALHGQDVPYTYYTGTGTPTADVPVPVVAEGLQEYIATFAQKGNPNSPGYPAFPIYGPNAQVLVLNYTGFTPAKDVAATKQCVYWQSGVWA